MAGIRATDIIAGKWQRVAGASGQSYTEGVTNPVRDYVAGASAANDAWKAGVSAAVAGDRFKNGVRKAGAEKWQRNAIAKGPGRFGEGVRAASGDYAAGFAPYRETIAATPLPARGARRSPQNMQRAAAMVAALSAKKEALLKG
jgi:predicted transcriptional regulator